MNLNTGQKQTMADFYSNFALAWITFGLVSPVFIGISNFKIFSIKLITAMISTVYFLSIALKYKK
ncbi:MAG: hypothetical protein AAB437_03390 [Patescibacteria group bacterium]|mgnify:CR=1